jgi:hypothetical protein
MNYTRKPQNARYVTFTVSWIEQEVTVIHFDDVKLAAQFRASEGDFELLLAELPDELSILVDPTVASGAEVKEFLDEWVAASKQHDEWEKNMAGAFRRITKGLFR